MYKEDAFLAYFFHCGAEIYFGYSKIFVKQWGDITILIEKFSLTVQKSFLGRPFCVQKLWPSTGRWNAEYKDRKFTEEWWNRRVGLFEAKEASEEKMNNQCNIRTFFFFEAPSNNDFHFY